MNWPIDSVFVVMLLVHQMQNKQHYFWYFSIWVHQISFKLQQVRCNVFLLNLRIWSPSWRHVGNTSTSRRPTVGAALPDRGPRQARTAPRRAILLMAFTTRGEPLAWTAVTCWCDLDVCLCSTGWRRGSTLGKGQNCCCDIESLPASSDLSDVWWYYCATEGKGAFSLILGFVY